MQISPIKNENNTNFKALHVSKASLRAMKTTRRALLKNPAIKDAAAKYQVQVKPSLNTHMKRLPVPEIACLCSGASFIAGIAALAMGFNTWGVSFLVGFMFSLFPTCGLVLLGDLFRTKANNLLVQAGERFENGKLVGIKTDVHELESPDGSLPNLSNGLYKKISEAKLNLADSGNLYTANYYLETLKNVIHDKSTFAKKIEGTNDTLLTQFFDVAPDEEGIAYGQIIDILKNIEGLDYNQKDEGGVSCLEKIMRNENPQLLPLVKDFEFNYLPELDILFKNITNPKFKKQVSKLNIRFGDILDAVRLKSYEALSDSQSQLDSPLCNRKKLAKEINKILKEMNDSDYERYFRGIYLKYLNKGEANLID